MKPQIKNIEEIKAKIKTTRKKMYEFEQNMRNELQKSLHEGLTALFELYPIVKSVSFSAYTPYFNDGEECTYGVHADYCTFNGYSEYKEEDEVGDDGAVDILGGTRKTMSVQRENPNYNPSMNYKWGDSRTRQYIYEDKPNPNYNPEYEEIVDNFREILQSISNDTWRSIVGDHVTVTITKDGITTKEYNHD